MRFLMRIVPLVSLLFAGCASAFDVHHVARNCDGCATKFGNKVLFYALPRTILTVDAVVEKKIVEDGPCKAFVTEDFLGVPPKDFFGSGPAESKTKLTSVVIGSRAEPDSDRVYAIELSRKWYQKITSSFSLAETGFLTNAEMTAENQAVDFAVTTLKTVAGLAVKLGIGAGGGVPVDAEDPRPRCKAIQREIEEIRERRRRILAVQLDPENPPDGPTITVLLEKMGQQEAELVSTSEHRR